MKKLKLSIPAVLLAVFCVSACALFNPGEQLSQSKVIELGTKYYSWFYSKKLDSLHSCIFDKNYTLKELTDFRHKVEKQLGREKSLLRERTVRARGRENIYTYVRFSNFNKSRQPVKTVFSFDSNNNVYQFSVQSLPREADSKYLNYKTKTKLRLPFEGEWYLADGGRNIAFNQHSVSPDQRFACDFVVHKNGLSYRNSGMKNEDYYCFGKKIFAPGTGKIVTVVDDIKENIPGDMPKNAGNRIIIDHENGEFSVLAHFKYKSIAVKTGGRVAAGQFLGLCGNSGHSSEPHLHYHLQNTPIMFKGEGLPVQFQSYWEDGEYVELGEPAGGQYVKNK